MKSRIFIALILVTVAAGNVHAQKLAIEKGQKLDMVTTTKMTMEVMGQNIDNESSINTNVAVKDITDSNYVLSNTIKRMTIKANTMGQVIDFDSDKKEDMDGQLGQALKGQIGAVQEIQVDKKGKVAAAGAVGESSNGAGMADMMGMSGSLVKGQPYPVLIQLPGKKIKAGDTWTDSVGSPATMKSVMTYTLKSITGNDALISFTGTLAKSGTVEQNGMQLQMALTGSTKGESTYEMGSGWLKSSTSSTDMKGSIEVMGQNAPISATITANIVAKR